MEFYIIYMKLNTEYKHSKFNDMKIIKEIGAGFMGRVYLAEYGPHKTNVVIKTSKFLPKLYKKPKNKEGYSIIGMN